MILSRANGFWWLYGVHCYRHEYGWSLRNWIPGVHLYYHSRRHRENMRALSRRYPDFKIHGLFTLRFDRLGQWG